MIEILLTRELREQKWVWFKKIIKTKFQSSLGRNVISNGILTTFVKAAN